VVAQYADDINADLIVMGVHGDHRATPGSIGAVIEAVLSEVRCPIMAIPLTAVDAAAASRSVRQRLAC
jgi:nucleotide-binding universal stress UspA family protein